MAAARPRQHTLFCSSRAQSCEYDGRNGKSKKPRLPGYSLLKFAHALPFEYVQQILMQVADSGERRW